MSARRGLEGGRDRHPQQVASGSDRGESAAKRTREGKGALRFPVQQSGWQFSSQRPAQSETPRTRPTFSRTTAPAFGCCAPQPSGCLWIVRWSLVGGVTPRSAAVCNLEMRGVCLACGRDVAGEQALQTVQAVQLTDG